jgi:hypothetical protein
MDLFTISGGTGHVLILPVFCIGNVVNVRRDIEAQNEQFPVCAAEPDHITLPHVQSGSACICVDVPRSMMKSCRIYCGEAPHLRSRRPCHGAAAVHRMQRTDVCRLDQCWSMDFVCDNLLNSRRIRALTVVDNFSRERFNWIVCCQCMPCRKVKCESL